MRALLLWLCLLGAAYGGGVVPHKRPTPFVLVPGHYVFLVEDDVFGVNLIPHTWEVTTLGTLKPGARVNLEIDMLARYLARWRETA